MSPSNLYDNKGQNLEMRKLDFSIPKEESVEVPFSKE